MVKSKILVNKRNMQMMVTIPKKQFSMMKKKTPKFLNIEEEDFEWE